MYSITPQGIDTTTGTGDTEGRRLLMTYGLPRSGKSTWAREQNLPIVCPDAIRLAKTGQRWWGPIEHEVWATARTMVRALFLAGHQTVILDSTSGFRKQRDMFLPSVDIGWERRYVYIDTPALVCCERAGETYPELILVIEWMDANWESIQFEEAIEPWCRPVQAK